MIAARALVALYDRMFLVGQSLMPAVNALLLGAVLYQSRLVPRALPVLAFIGACLLVTGDVAKMFELLAPMSSLAGLLALPIALWEFLLGVWLIVKGFAPSAPILAEGLRETGPRGSRIQAAAS